MGQPSGGIQIPKESVILLDICAYNRHDEKQLHNKQTGYKLEEHLCDRKYRNREVIVDRLDTDKYKEQRQNR